MKRFIKKTIASAMAVCVYGSIFLPHTAVPVAAEPEMQTITITIGSYYNDELYTGNEFPVEVKNAETMEVIGRVDHFDLGRATVSISVPAGIETPIVVYQVKGNNPLITYDETIAEKVVTEDGKLEDPVNQTDLEKQNQIAEAQAAVNTAQQSLNDAKTAYDEAAGKVTELEAAEPQKELNAYGFFAAQTEQTAYQIISGTYSGKLLSSSGVSYETLVSYTGKGEGDATELSAMYNALDLIDEVNKKREAENKEEHRYRDNLQPFKVTDSMMAVAMLTANYNQKCDFNHPSAFNTSENIATKGKGYAVDAWYGERDIFWADPAQGEIMKNMSAWNLYQNYPDIYFQVGHYLNIVDNGSPCIGLAIAGGNGMTAMDTYWNTVGNEASYTTEQYRQRLNDYESTTESDELVNARAVLEQATAEYNSSLETYNLALETLNALLGE